MKKLTLFLLLAFAENAFAQKELTDSLTLLNKDVTLNYTKSVVVDDGSALTVSLILMMKNKSSYKNVLYYGRKVMSFNRYLSSNATTDKNKGNSYEISLSFRAGKAYTTVLAPKEAVIKLYYSINKKTKELVIPLSKLKKELPKRMPSRPLK